jgi:hypothetical protein
VRDPVGGDGREVLALEAASPDPETANCPALAMAWRALPPAVKARPGHRVCLSIAETATATSPVLLVVEDIHWAETPLLDLLEYIATWARERLILIPAGSPRFRDPTDGIRPDGG